ncbi:hypothetical protein [Burkholderia multivorans]|uniref:hypothetical protein n=1 Tax=Burkholderia multivorans TaxID=87883 RepID=UPI0011B1FFB5|nr:hypothetical protein [Burkholderia multivorans]MBR8045701.1 hypothetical protein [Burkholderia multivorans]MBU9492574.1 hypothetical protein [Burkholderia multivorans]
MDESRSVKLVLADERIALARQSPTLNDRVTPIGRLASEGIVVDNASHQRSIDGSHAVTILAIRHQRASDYH